MKTTISIFVLLCILGAGAVGCPNMSRTTQGTLSGAAWGSAAGAGIAALAGGSVGWGAAAGAGVGALAGAIVGNEKEKQDRYYNNRYRYNRDNHRHR